MSTVDEIRAYKAKNPGKKIPEMQELRRWQNNEKYFEEIYDILRCKLSEMGVTDEKEQTLILTRRVPVRAAFDSESYISVEEYITRISEAAKKFLNEKKQKAGMKKKRKKK